MAAIGSPDGLRAGRSARAAFAVGVHALSGGAGAVSGLQWLLLWSGARLAARAERNAGAGAAFPAGRGIAADPAAGQRRLASGHARRCHLDCRSGGAGADSIAFAPGNGKPAGRGLRRAAPRAMAAVAAAVRHAAAFHRAAGAQRGNDSPAAGNIGADAGAGAGAQAMARGADG